MTHGWGILLLSSQDQSSSDGLPLPQSAAWPFLTLWSGLTVCTNVTAQGDTGRLLHTTSLSQGSVNKLTAAEKNHNFFSGVVLLDFPTALTGEGANFGPVGLTKCL